MPEKKNAEKQLIHWVRADQTQYMDDAWDVLEEVFRNIIFGLHYDWDADELLNPMKEAVRHANLFRPADANPMTMLDLVDTEGIGDAIISDAAEIVRYHVKEDKWPIAKAILVSHMLSALVCDIASPVDASRWSGKNSSSSAPVEIYPSPNPPVDGEKLL
ncbi:MAG: hypothetical protein NC548_06315 [Lachnospiraceae bacterium]|nr:hypothetical protein [Lachnospiraceae bacterium]